MEFHKEVNKMQQGTPPLKSSEILPRDDISQEPSTPPKASFVSTPPLLLGPRTTVTTCPFCQATVETSVKHTPTTRTHIAAVLYALACCLCCCFCIRYCSDSAKNSDHYCPNCQRYLGTYEK